MRDRAPLVALPLAAAVLGFLAVLAAAQPRTAPGRDVGRLEVVDLIAQQDERVRELQDEVRALEEQLATLGEGAETSDVGVRDVREAAERLALFAGGTPLRGPGVRVTLDDSSAGRSPSGDPNDLVVHEQDIQTVVNALWAAGAEAMAVNGQRLTSVSAVRCAGNTLLLHGAVHSPPYEITAIGDAEAIMAALEVEPGMDRLLAAVGSFGIGYEVSLGPMTIPPGTLVPVLARAAPLSGGAT